ncbi:hypothetical protein R1sor_025875 [Riccia sorocarpa]|uniref:O-fucosyltransferase family protein n=1 Tax=Riccia sorocarpa TaxID=122646 RepID=A0ABD3GBG5_9MARC
MVNKGVLPTHHSTSNGKSKEWLHQEVELKSLAGQLKVGKVKPPVPLPRARLHVWFLRASTSIFLWTCLIQLTAFRELWQPNCFILASNNFIPPLLCGSSSNSLTCYITSDLMHFHRVNSASSLLFNWSVHFQFMLPPTWGSVLRMGRLQTNGYLMVSCNGGLNQMRAAICDMVAVSKHMNVTLVIPELDKTSFWANTWASHAEAALSSKLSCPAVYSSYRGARSKVGSNSSWKGPFVVLHLHYEMDMLAFSGCTHGCTEEEADELTRMRYAYPWWKEKVIVSEQKRKDGLCPLTPEETALILRALGYD